MIRYIQIWNTDEQKERQMQMNEIKDGDGYNEAAIDDATLAATQGNV